MTEAEFRRQYQAIALRIKSHLEDIIDARARSDESAVSEHIEMARCAMKEKESLVTNHYGPPQSRLETE